MAEEKEVSFYSDDKGVRITNTRAIMGTTTYAMANITSVSLATKPANRLAGILIAVLGLLVLWATDELDISNGTILGVIVVGVGILAAVLVKPKYTVGIESASGKSDAISSNKKVYIEGIVRAMNEAFIKRG